MKSLYGVARLATIRVRRILELPSMLVSMAVCTLSELDLKQRRAPSGNVALRALYIGVLSLKWIRGLTVLCESKLRRLPSFHRMTRRALTMIGALCELSTMWIRLVACRTLFECDRPLEIAARVAFGAREAFMLS